MGHHLLSIFTAHREREEEKVLIPPLLSKVDTATITGPFAAFTVFPVFTPTELLVR